MRRKIDYKNIIILALVVFFIVSYVKQEKVMSRIENEIADKEKQLSDMKIESERLKEQVELSQSLEYIERLARERLKMIKPGEQVIKDK